MAVNIDTVYQKVLALANKEQRGYITPQEFNLLADRAQKEIVENYFHGIKTAERKPKNQMDYADEVEMLEEKLQSLHTDTTVSTSTSSLSMPTDIYKLISVSRNSNRVTQVNKSQIAYTENNPLTKANLLRSVFVREDNNVLTIYPAPTTSTDFEVSYYKTPSTPNWGYVVVNNKALYNSTTSTNFELHASEEESLVSRILMLVGITIKQPDIQQAGGTAIQMTKQEQNS
jgi:hypothetical protein